ncbi:MAG: sugar ABC transporter permease [Propionibacteriaceae bacterium]|nr:sugar ABC transporter permease [Propionibacteriaceae bacterium]
MHDEVLTSRPTATVPRRTKFQWTPYLFIGVPVVYSLVFSGYPLLKGLQLSFTNAKLLNPNGGKWVGFGNYSNLLADSATWASIGVTLLYTLLVVLASVLLGLASALLINQAFFGRIVIRAMLTIPWAVPTVAVSLVFIWMFNDGSGVLNEITEALGLGRLGWLTDPDVALFSVTLATLWKVTPFVMLVLLAALQAVPADLVEAARVDGASPLMIFRVVTIRSILPTVRVVVLLMTIWSFRRFEIIWLLTGGGPANATNTMVVSVYRTAFNNNDLGLASALGMIGVVMSLAVTVIYAIVERRGADR